MTTKQTFWRTLALAAMILTMPAAMWADSSFGGGNGSEDSPYIIKTAEHLEQLSADVNAGNYYEGKYFDMWFDIDFEGREFTPIGGKQYTTANNATGHHKFAGHFNGGNHSIKNVAIRPAPGATNYGVGVFGWVGGGGVIKNLSLEGTSTVSPYHVAGGIAGCVDTQGKLENCHVGNGVVIADDPAQNAGFNVGGLVGAVFGTGEVAGCSTRATVNITGQNVSNVGGFVGYCSGTINNCYSLGSVNGQKETGDFAGKVQNEQFSGNYYHTAGQRYGEVNGQDHDGVKWMGTVSAADNITCEVLSYYTYRDIIVRPITLYYAQGEKVYVKLAYNSPPGTIVTRVKFNANVAFAEDTYNGESCYSFTMPDRSVVFTADVEFEQLHCWDGDGSAEFPYLIKSVEDMNTIGELQNQVSYDGICFRLETDLDYTGHSYNIIGKSARPFNGVFDGNGKTIDHLTIDLPEAEGIGLFGQIGANGVVTDLVLGANSTFSALKALGGIAGINYGKIQSCINCASINATNKNSGGIAGKNYGTVDRCVNMGHVTGQDDVGGILGSLWFEPSACNNNLNLGQVSLMNTSFAISVGGIVGYRYQGTCTNNYYDHGLNFQGIGNYDFEGQAQRGFSIAPGEGVAIALAPSATVGLAYDGTVFAGEGQQVIIALSLTRAAPNTAPRIVSSEVTFVASGGTLTDNNDGTWTLTMTDEDITITAEYDVSTAIDNVNAARHADDTWFTLSGIRLTGKPSTPGFYINGGRKVVVR